MSKIEIAVSPFYSGNGWTDRGTGFKFEPQTSGHLKTKSFDLDYKEDLTGIKNSVRLNHLLVLSGNLEAVADKPEKVNPEELTGEQLDELLGSLGGNDAVIQENTALKKEKAELIKEKQTLTEANGTLTSEKQTLVQEKEALVLEKQTLTQTNADLTQQVKDLEAQLEAPSPAVAHFKLSDDGAIDKKALTDDNTRNELVKIAEDNNIEFDTKATKGDLVDLIVEKLQ